MTDIKNFRAWYITNHDQLVKVSNFFLLFGLKKYIKALIETLDFVIANDSTAFNEIKVKDTQTLS